VGHLVLDGHGWDEHLVPPEHRQAAGATLGIAAGLLHHRLQNRHGHQSTTSFNRSRQLDAWFVVVFGSRKWRQTSAFSSCVVQTNTDASVLQLLIDIDPISFICQANSILIGI
jgi:hypothetical protein